VPFIKGLFWEGIYGFGNRFDKMGSFDLQDEESSKQKNGISSKEFFEYLVWELLIWGKGYLIRLLKMKIFWNSKER